LKFVVSENHARQDGSRPTRGAWIEILCPCALCRCVRVAPHAGRVD